MLAPKSAESQIAMECKNVLILSVIQRWMAINNLDYLIKANTLNYRSDLQERLQWVRNKTLSTASARQNSLVPV